MTEKLAAVKNLTEERDKIIVAKLEEFLALAKAGHLSDLAIIGKVRGAPITEFEWESDNPLELIGALELAKQEVAQDLLHEAHGGDDDDFDEEPN